MSFVCLMAFVLIGQEPAKDLPPALQWQRHVEIKAEPIKIGADRAEIVTIRLKIKPGSYVLGTPQPDEVLEGAEMKLIVKSNDPKQKVSVVYPKPVLVAERGVSWSKYEGEITIIATVYRSTEKRGPLECTLRFQPRSASVCCLPARVSFTVIK